MKFLKEQSTRALQFAASVLSIFLTFVSCAQPPADRAHAKDPDFDEKISRTISFTVPTMSVEDLKLQQQDVLIFDAREREEFEVSHIPNAQYIGYENLETEQLANIPKDQKIVLYCSIGYRSEKVGEKLQEMGFTNVNNLYGSIFEWVNQGNEVVDKHENPTDLIHTYNKKWRQWANDSMFKKIW